MVTWTELLLFSEKNYTGYETRRAGYNRRERLRQLLQKEKTYRVTAKGQFAISPSGESSTRHPLLQRCCLRYQSVSLSRQKALEFASTRH